MRTTFAPSPRTLVAVADAAELRLHAFAARHALTLLRLSLGFCFLLFGFLKFFPNLSPAQAVAEDTTHKLFLGLFPDAVNLRIVAVVEVTAGLCLLTNRFIRPAAVLLLVEMAGILSPLVLIPGQLFSGPHNLPNLLGQYILKDFVLLAAVLVLLATQRGGTIILGPDAKVAEDAARKAKAERAGRAAVAPSTPVLPARRGPVGPAEAPRTRTPGTVVALTTEVPVPVPVGTYPAIRRDPGLHFEGRSGAPADDPGVTVRSAVAPRWRRWAPVAVGVGLVLNGRRVPGSH